MVVAYIGIIQVAVESILIGGTCVVGDLELRLALDGVEVEIDIAALVEAVVRRPRSGIVEVVVDVGEAAFAVSCLC